MGQRMSPEEIQLEPAPEPAASPEATPVLRPRPQAERRAPLVSSAGQVLVAVLAVLTACYFAKIVLVVLLLSVLLAFILAPLVDLMERVHLPRPLGAILAILLLAAGLGGMTYYGYSQAEGFVGQLPTYQERIQATWTRVQERAERIQKAARDVLPQSSQPQEVPPPPPRPGTQRGRQAPPPGPLPTQTVRLEQGPIWTEWITRGAGSVTEFLFAVGFIPFLVYFMLSWQEHVRANTVMLFRMENRHAAYVTLGAIARMIRSFVIGNLVVGLFMSVAAMIVFGLLRLPYFYVIAFVSGFLSLIPYLGVVLALVPPLLAGLGQMHTSDAFIIIGTVLGLHLFSLNVLYPKIVGSRVQLNPLAVTLALLVWGWLWGAMGLILAVPITAAMKIIFDHVESLRAYGTWLGE